MSAVIDLLGDQHQEVLARIDQDEGRFGDTVVAGAFLDFLESDVVSHFQLEEESLFPELERIPQMAAGPLRVMNAEHARFRELLAAGKQARDQHEDARVSAAAADLATLLRSHIAKEDGVLFPMALDALSPEQLRRVDAGRAMG